MFFLSIVATYKMRFLLCRNILYRSKVGFDDTDINIQSLYGTHKRIKTLSKNFDKNLLKYL